MRAQVLPARLFPALVASLLLAGSAPGQDTIPSITVTGTGTVEREPDYAMIVFGTDAHDETPQAAAAEMDRILSAVADTLATLGFPAERLPNAGFSVRPSRSSRLPPESRGFEAASSVRVEIRDMSRLPTIIPAARRPTRGGTMRTGPLPRCRRIRRRSGPRSSRSAARPMRGRCGRRRRETRRSPGTGW